MENDNSEWMEITHGSDSFNRCTDGRKLSIPDLNSMILVTQAEKPIITISGTRDIARNEYNYTRGVKLFQDVQIISQTRKEAEELDDDVSFILLDVLH